MTKGQKKALGFCRTLFSKPHVKNQLASQFKFDLHQLAKSINKKSAKPKSSALT